jgi:hypothetical protein
MSLVYFAKTDMAMDMDTVIERKANDLINTIGPNLIKPLYHRIKKNVEEWYSSMTDSEFEHFLIGMLLAAFIISITVLTISIHTMKHKRRMQQLYNQKDPEISFISLDKC